MDKVVVREQLICMNVVKNILVVSRVKQEALAEVAIVQLEIIKG